MRLRRLVEVAGVAGIIAAGGAWARIRRDARGAAAPAGDVAVVLGAGVWGARPSRELESRLRRALELLQGGDVGEILCCGGDAVECGVMRDWLVAAGADAARVHRDPTAVSTRRAVTTALRWSAGRWHRVVLVTTGYNVHRAMAEARRQGLHSVAAPAMLPPLPPGRAGLRRRRKRARQWLREVAAVLAYDVDWLRPSVRRGGIAPGSQELAVRLAARASEVGPVPDLLWPGEARVTSRFGWRGRMHEGVDVALLEGDPVRAAAAGTIVVDDVLGDYGRVVVIDHGRRVATVYGHLAAVTRTVGEAVDAGEVVGLAGSTGHSFGPHLHFELRLAGIAVDPLPFLAARGFVSDPPAARDRPGTPP